MDKTIRFFIDMDGTIARFYEQADCLERMFEDGFFVSLNSYKNVVAGLNMLKQRHPDKVKFYILSAINPEIMDKCRAEKIAWVQANFPCTDEYIFTKFGESKAAAIKAMGTEINQTDFLLDDYNANLTEWLAEGGSSIKMVNEINDRGTNGPLWSGHRIRHDFTPERICQELESIFMIEGAL